MATKLYLVNTKASDTLVGTLPSAEQSTRTYEAKANTVIGSPPGNAETLRMLSSSYGSGDLVNIVTTAASVAQKDYLMGMWASEPIAAPVSIEPTFTSLMIISEQSLNANFSANAINLYVWNPNTGTKRGTIYDGLISASEPGGTSSRYVSGSSFSSADPNVDAQAGDIIVFELWSRLTQSSATAYLGRVYFSGSGEPTTDGASVSNSVYGSYISLATTVLFNPPVEGVGEAAAALSVSGVGTTVKHGVGAASATLTVDGASVNYQSGVGAAAMGLTAAAVGRGIAAVIGSAGMTLSAAGVWDLSSIVSEGHGTVAMSLEATAVGRQYFPHIFAPEAAAGDGWTKEASL